MRILRITKSVFCIGLALLMAGLVVANPKDLVFLAIGTCFAASGLHVFKEGLRLGLLWLGAELSISGPISAALMLLAAWISGRGAWAHAQSDPPRTILSAVLTGLCLGILVLLCLPIWGRHAGWTGWHWHFVWELGHRH